MLNFRNIILEAFIWSFLWVILVSISVRIFPFTIEHDYPEDVRKVAAIKPPSGSHKLKGYIFAGLSFFILMGMLIAFSVYEYNLYKLNIFKIFFHIWIIFMTWNMVDLIVVDWLFICLFSCKYFVLPGTEDCNGNKNYKFHAIGFVKGIFAMSILSVICLLFSYLILRFCF